MPENDSLLKKLTTICFEKKMENNGGEKFILTAKFYKIPIGAAILGPNKKNPKEKTSADLEGIASKKQ